MHVTKGRTRLVIVALVPVFAAYFLQFFLPWWMAWVVVGYEVGLFAIVLRWMKREPVKA